MANVNKGNAMQSVSRHVDASNALFGGRFQTAIRRCVATTCLALTLAIAGCATIDSPQSAPSATKDWSQLKPASPLQVVNRITWGANTTTMNEVSRVGLAGYLDQQLNAMPQPLPAVVQAQIDAMTITQTPLVELVKRMEQQNKDANAIKDDEQKKKAQQAYQQEMSRLSREAATRALMRATYSPNQLQEQMVWFWMNHFSVFHFKSNIRAMVGDYEETAIRPHALGKFSDLVRATAFHPVMIRYLDNEQNAANRINENYARELMELHTMGVDGGYTQKDVTELARMLTGIGVNLTDNTPNVKKELASQYVRRGLFEFNPNRHDYTDKVFLGQTVKGAGLADVNAAIDKLSRHPSTARFIAKKLVTYFVADEPPKALVDRVAATFLATDGDIKSVLNTLINSNEFRVSLGTKFKPPMNYVLSAVRLAYDDKAILNTGPMQNWLNRMGQGMFARQTPDGYSLVESAWAGPGQMTTRFEIAKAIGSGSAGLFKSEGAQPVERPAFPQLANALHYNHWQTQLSPATRQVLDQATSPQEWNMLLMSSPERMYR
jgi:uncharacterized protein (DUF1800 family)